MEAVSSPCQTIGCCLCACRSATRNRGNSFASRFLQRVAAMIRKRLADDTGTGRRGRNRDVDAAIRQIVGGAVEAGQVIDLFAAAGLDEARLDILSDEFLSRIAALEQKNLALETLRKLLSDQIRITERSNLV